MSNCENQSCQPGTSINNILNNLGPRTVEGDQGRWTGYSVDEAIRADEYERRRCAVSTPGKMRGVLRTISGYRLATHDGRGS